MAMTEEEKQQAAAEKQAEKDAAAIVEMQDGGDIAARKANPKVGGESFDYGEIAHDFPVNTGLDNPDGADRKPADDFAYLSAKPKD